MDGRQNLVKGATEWNKKPDAGYLEMAGQPKKNELPFGTSGKDANKSPPFSISRPPPHSETKQPTLVEDHHDLDQGKKQPPPTKDKPKETIKAMTPLASLNHSTDSLRNSFTHQIPSLTLKSYYKDSKLFEVMQAGILQVGLNR
jgi:hypothetical protein